MLLAASESAVTKKPRLRLMMRRSSSVRPLGSFQRAMSRVMLTSCGIQWLAQVAKYLSQAHLYLNGTSWLTSVWPLMMRLSAALTRCVVSTTGAAACPITAGLKAVSDICGRAEGANPGCAGGVRGAGAELFSSSQESILYSFIFVGRAVVPTRDVKSVTRFASITRGQKNMPT